MFVTLNATVMLIQPMQLSGCECGYSACAMFVFEFGPQCRDPFADLFLHIIVHFAEERGDGYVENCSKRESRPKRGESVALLISAYFRAIFTSQQRCQVSLAEA